MLNGEGALNNIRQRAARDLELQVNDEKGTPVADASVSLALPSQGATGTFANGSSMVTATTDTRGQAVIKGFRPNRRPGQTADRRNRIVPGPNRTRRHHAIQHGRRKGLPKIGTRQARHHPRSRRGRRRRGCLRRFGQEQFSASGPSGRSRDRYHSRRRHSGGSRQLNTMRHAIPIGILWVALSVHAHGADIGTPRLGYVWDSAAQSVRPVEGIPGAAFLGQALDLGGQLTRAVICRNLGYILAISSRERTASVLQIGAGSVTSRVIEGARQPVDRMVLILGHLGPAVRRKRTDFADRHRIARNPSGDALDHGSRRRGDVGQRRWSSGASCARRIARSAFLSGSSEMPSSIPISGPVSAMALRPHSHDALIATAGSITWVPSLDTDPSYEVVDGDPNTPAALSFSDDGSRFFAAYTDGRVRVRSLVSGAASVSACPCVPDRLQPLHGDSLFALNQPGQGPLFIYDA